MACCLNVYLPLGELLQDISQPRHNSHNLFTACLLHSRWETSDRSPSLHRGSFGSSWQYWSVWYNVVLGQNICLGLEVNMLKNDTLLNSKQTVSLSGKTWNQSEAVNKVARKTRDVKHQYNRATPSRRAAAHPAARHWSLIKHTEEWIKLPAGRRRWDFIAADSPQRTHHLRTWPTETQCHKKYSQPSYRVWLF